MNKDLKILEGKQHIHFIGIGGSGMYPLAQILHAKGYHLTGSDNNETETLQAIRSMGIEVKPLGQRAENIEGADLIVHTAAIMADNPELIAAKASGVPVLERSCSASYRAGMRMRSAYPARTARRPPHPCSRRS